MDENTKDLARKKRIMINVAYAVMALAIYVVFFRYIIYVAWPFAFSLLFATILRRPTQYICKKLKMSEKLGAAVLMLLFYIILAGLAVLVVNKAFWALVAWMQTLPTLYTTEIKPFLQSLFDLYENYTGNSDVAYLNNLGDSIINKLGSIATSLSAAVLNFAKKLALGFPKALLGFIFMVISSFFIAMDYQNIADFFMAQLKPNQQQIAVSTREYLGTSIGRLIFSYGIIMIITFCELNIGLRLLHVANPTVVALFIAIFDILPALGTGGIVIPWIVIEAFSGNFKMALGLLVMYLCITVIRNIIEPKIVGDNLGVHPVLMLMSIYLGAFLLGGFGIVVLPFTIIVIKKLNDSGLVTIYNGDYHKKEEGSDEKQKVLLIDKLFKGKKKDAEIKEE